MIKKSKLILQKWNKNIDFWAKSHYLQIALFNMTLVFLFLLRSAGYFHPYFVISVNFIVMIGLLISIPLLGARSRAIFIVALSFWIFTALLQLLNIKVWAERSSIYVFQSLLVAFFLLLMESIKKAK